MTIYIAGPDGKPLAFASDAEVNAYHRALREAEPPSLRRQRQRHTDVCHLLELAQRALTQRRGRTAALSDIEYRLCRLRTLIMDDIKAAERDQQA
jgi:hypothetical protein